MGSWSNSDLYKSTISYGNNDRKIQQTDTIIETSNDNAYELSIHDNSLRIFKFDSNENEIEKRYYDDSGKFYQRDTTIYDSKGNRALYCTYNTVTDTTRTVYDSQGNVIGFSRKSPSAHYYRIDSFDSYGNKTYYFDTGYKWRSILWWKNKYDSIGNRISYIHYGENKKYYTVAKNIFDSNRKLIKSSEYDSLGKLDHVHYYKYNKDGYQKNELLYSFGGILRYFHGKLEYEATTVYDERKNLIYYSVSNHIDKSKREAIHKYDSLGNLVIQIERTYTRSRLEEEKKEEITEFDNAGNWIRQTSKKNVVLKGLLVRKIEYY